jgi:predicted GNAT family N-acyltransferase
MQIDIPENFALEYVVDETQLAEAFAVRFKVFVEEQQVPEYLEIDDQDFAQSTTHAIVRDLESGDVVGTARLLFHADTPGEAKIGRVAVLPQARSLGLGAALMAGLERRALLSQDPITIFLGAQLQAAPFYERLGYQLIGKIYDDADIPHRDAVKFLSRIGG